MTDKVKRRRRELMAELGCSYQTACNIIEKRKAERKLAKELAPFLPVDPSVDPTVKPA
jgi:hypothetical protein